MYELIITLVENIYYFSWLGNNCLKWTWDVMELGSLWLPVSDIVNIQKSHIWIPALLKSHKWIPEAQIFHIWIWGFPFTKWLLFTPDPNQTSIVWLKSQSKQDPKSTRLLPARAWLWTPLEKLSMSSDQGVVWGESLARPQGFNQQLLQNSVSANPYIEQNRNTPRI